MTDMLIYLDPKSPLSLQQQIRQKLVQAILGGTWSQDKRLPSSRKLAEQLSVSRNTVVLAYQQLIDESYLITKERSGIYINPGILKGHDKNPRTSPDQWQPFIKLSHNKRSNLNSSKHWPNNSYPFYDHQLDPSLFPSNEWREASRLALSIPEINDWASQNVHRDDERLLEEIRNKVLPRRGIQTSTNNLMITAGLQQAHYLIAQCLIEEWHTVSVEEPGNPSFYHLAKQRQARIIHQEVDNQGMLVNNALLEADIIYTSPSHQLPTNTTMNMERRASLLALAKQNDSLIIEDDNLQEHNFLASPHPAIAGIEPLKNVIYLSSLSHILGDGLQLAFIAGPAASIEKLRDFRNSMGGTAAINNQRTMAYFLSLGHYESFIYRLDKQLKDRWLTLRDALNYFLHSLAEVLPSKGGTAFWIRVKADIDCNHIIEQARQQGIHLATVNNHYQTKPAPNTVFRMGISSIPSDRIKIGVKKLALLIRDLAQQQQRRQYITLNNRQLKQRLIGTKITSHTVYDEAYTIEICADGQLKGHCQQDKTDCDTGQWRIEKDVFYRRWDNWVYNQEACYYVAVKHEKIYWLNMNKHLIDSGLILESEAT